MTPGSSFVLDGSTLTTVWALLVLLGGIIGFLFRALIAAKDRAIVDTETEMVAQRQILLEQIAALKQDRDFWRGRYLEKG